MDEIISETVPKKMAITRGVATGKQFKKTIDFYIKGKKNKKNKR